MDPTRIYPLCNPRKEKDWGSKVAIPRFLGEPAADAPVGELWMGAYPGSPSELTDARGQTIGLDRAIATDPPAWLGPAVAQRLGERLPFLFKVLAADTALSIQAHPSAAQARAGFALEEERGVPGDAPHRNYKDPHHKPELICALTRFSALARFRKPEEIAAYFARLGPDALGPQVDRLRETPGREALRDFFEGLMGLVGLADALVDRALEIAVSSEDPAFAWVAELANQHPGDPGSLAPLYLNVLTLEPGEALFLHAGELHSYLSGLAVELMANSDNVLRGGLTPSHVDVPELLATLSYRHGPAEPVDMLPLDSHQDRYESPAAEFELRRLRVDRDFETRDRDALEILLCVEGAGCIEPAGGDALELVRGRAVVAPAAVSGYSLSGSLDLYVARPGGPAE